MSITEQILNFAMQKISLNIDTLQGEDLPGYKTHEKLKLWQHEVLGTPIVVFNPHSHTVKMSVQVNEKATKMTDCENNEIPFQHVRGDQTNRSDKFHTAFTAEVEPMGYAVYRLFAEKESKISFKSDLSINGNSIENSKIRVEFDKLTGDISSFYDKEKEKYIISETCSAVVLDETACDTWAHNKEKLGETAGTFSFPEFSVIEKGNVRATLRVKTVYNNSVMYRDYTVLAGKNTVTVKVTADFAEKHKTLKLLFPANGNIVAKIPYSVIERPQNTGEEPFGSWLASGDLGIANDSKYGYDTENGYIRLTALRSAVYADHYGERDEFCRYMEQGKREFSYTLFPYKNKADAERIASELNFGLRYVWTGFHGGNLPEKNEMH